MTAGAVTVFLASHRFTPDVQGVLSLPLSPEWRDRSLPLRSNSRAGSIFLLTSNLLLGDGTYVLHQQLAPGPGGPQAAQIAEVSTERPIDEHHVTRKA